MRIRRKFLKLTSHTYPHGTEKKLLKRLPKGLKKDPFGNYFLQIGESNSMFAAHLDTACSYEKKVNHTFDGKYIKTDGTTILGADDKAGVVVLLYMIEKKIPGLYYFFVGEEVGCIGSGQFAEHMEENELFPEINKVVSFDRRGTESIITHQWAGRCCSDEFGNALAKEFGEQGLKMELDPTGVCTDSIQFQEFVPECTNISVGYYSEHTTSEKQDIEFLSKLCKAVVEIDWDNLPAERDPSVPDYGMWGDYGTNKEYEYESYSVGNTNKKTFSGDYWTFMKDPYTGKKTKVYISHERIAYEKQIIAEILHGWGFEMVEIEDIDWSGQYLSLGYGEYNGQEDYVERFELSEYDRRLRMVDPEDVRHTLPTRRAGKKHKKEDLPF